MLFSKVTKKKDRKLMVSCSDCGTERPFFSWVCPRCGANAVEELLEAVREGVSLPQN